VPDPPMPLDIDDVVHAEVERFLAASGRAAAPIARSERLTEGLGMTSFELAELVARLNEKLSADPFRTSLALTDVRTVEDLCRAYRGRPAGLSVPPGKQDELEASLKRAQARRANGSR
jgi:acyl carrier protein